MRYIYSTSMLCSLFRSSGREPNEASPFRTMLSLNGETRQIPLSDDLRLLCAFALTPEQTVLLGRHSSADGVLYIFRIGAVYYLYTWLEGRDQHVFEAFFDRSRLLKFLNRNFCSFYQPNFGAYTQLNLRLTDEEYTVWNLIRALHASRAQEGEGSNDPFLADDLKSSDLGLYLRNYLDELGMTSLSDGIDRLMDEAYHRNMEEALTGLAEKGVLSVDLIPGADQEESAYRLTRTALERMDDGLLLDTVWFADRTHPDKTREMLLCLRRDGVLAIAPRGNGTVRLRTFPDLPWEELI